MIAEIDVSEYHQNKEHYVLLDVREDDERNFCSIQPSFHIPIGEIPDRWEELDKDKTWVVYCRSGGRSARVAEFLQQNGIKAINLTGGILAYSAEIDPSIPRY